MAYLIKLSPKVLRKMGHFFDLQNDSSTMGHKPAERFIKNDLFSSKLVSRPKARDADQNFCFLTVFEKPK